MASNKGHFCDSSWYCSGGIFILICAISTSTACRSTQRDALSWRSACLLIMAHYMWNFSPYLHLLTAVLDYASMGGVDGDNLDGTGTNCLLHPLIYSPDAATICRDLDVAAQLQPVVSWALSGDPRGVVASLSVRCQCFLAEYTHVLQESSSFSVNDWLQ